MENRMLVLHVWCEKNICSTISVAEIEATAQSYGAQMEMSEKGKQQAIIYIVYKHIQTQHYLWQNRISSAIVFLARN